MKVLTALRKEMEEKALLAVFDVDMADLFRRRINAGRRTGAIEIPIMSKKWLEWMRKSHVRLKPGQYPVALDELTVVKGRNIALRNFDAALTIALAKATLAIAKKRDEEKGEERRMNCRV